MTCLEFTQKYNEEAASRGLEHKIELQPQKDENRSLHVVHRVAGGGWINFILIERGPGWRTSFYNLSH